MKAAKFWNILAIILFLIAPFMIYKGIDKVSNYYNSESGYFSENAYVGGDAYNYIINANYATGFYVLALICFVAGFGCLIMGNMARIVALRKESNTLLTSIQQHLLGSGEVDYSKQFTDLPSL